MSAITQAWYDYDGEFVATLTKTSTHIRGAVLASHNTDAVQKSRKALANAPGVKMHMFKSMRVRKRGAAPITHGLISSDSLSTLAPYKLANGSTVTVPGGQMPSRLEHKPYVPPTGPTIKSEPALPDLTTTSMFKEVVPKTLEVVALDKDNIEEVLQNQDLARVYSNQDYDAYWGSCII